MSNSLSNAAIKEFDAMVKHAYQSKGGRIRQAVTQRTNVVGDSYYFRLMGAAMAKTKNSSQTEVQPLNINHQKYEATLKNYYASEYTDIFDQAEVNFDEKQALAEAISMAIKRREDQIIIDALNNASVDDSNYIVSKNDNNNKDNLTVPAILKAGEILDNAYADGQKYMLINPSMRSNLLKDDRVTQQLYVDSKPLNSGQIWEFAGFKFIVIEDSRYENGLPSLESNQHGGSSGDKIALAFVTNAVGLAIGIDMFTEVNYIPQKTSWLTTGVFKAGATVIDKEGVAKIFCKKSS